MTSQKKAYLMAFTAILLWSTVAVPFKIGLQHFHFIHFLFITIFIAAAVVFTTLIFQKKLGLFESLTKREWFWSIVAGALNPFLYYLMLFKAYSILPAQLAQALNYTWPIMLVILSAIFLGQKLVLKKILFLFLGFLGVYFIASEGQPWPLQPSNPFGVILAISTSVIWASFWIINTKLKIDSVLGLFINFLTGLILTLPFALSIPFNYPVPLKSWIAVVYSGFFEMGVTFVIWLTAMRLTERTDKISNFVFLAPFLSLFFIYIFLGEHIYLTTLSGLVCIVLSVFFSQYFNRVKKV